MVLYLHVYTQIWHNDRMIKQADKTRKKATLNATLSFLYNGCKTKNLMRLSALEWYHWAKLERVWLKD